jgi:choline dehydrogenase
MLYQRGTVQSHQQWADAVDDKSYSWEAFLPYFQKSVNYTGPNTNLRAANASVPQPSTEAYQSDGGPLHVTHSNWATPWASWAQKGFREIGIPDIDDFDSGHLLGSQYCPCTIRPEDQTRATSESTFLQKAMQSDEKNLKVFTHTLAKQLLFDGNKTATGVVVETGGFNYTLSANKEVILSAGAVSPNSESDSNSGVLVLINCIVPIATAAHGLRCRTRRNSPQTRHPYRIRKTWCRPKHVGSRPL